MVPKIDYVIFHNVMHCERLHKESTIQHNCQIFGGGGRACFCMGVRYRIVQYNILYYPVLLYYPILYIVYILYMYTKALSLLTLWFYNDDSMRCED